MEHPIGQRAHRVTILDLLHRARAEQHALLEELNEAERTQVGAPERWSAKDLIAHISAWQRRFSLRLAALLRDDPPPDFGDTDALNAQTFAEQRERPWTEIVIDAEHTFGELIGCVERFSEADLADPQRYPALGGQPLWVQVIGSGYWHPREHMALFYRDRGDLARATRIQESIVETLGALGPELSRGVLLYNLACFYATTGQPDRALPALAEALRLQPDLSDWSRQDPDLAALRELPAYKALYESSATGRP